MGLGKSNWVIHFMLNTIKWKMTCILFIVLINLYFVMFAILLNNVIYLLFLLILGLICLFNYFTLTYEALVNCSVANWPSDLLCREMKGHWSSLYEKRVKRCRGIVSIRHHDMWDICHLQMHMWYMSMDEGAP